MPPKPRLTMKEQMELMAKKVEKINAEDPLFESRRQHEMQERLATIPGKIASNRPMVITEELPSALARLLFTGKVEECNFLFERMNSIYNFTDAEIKSINQFTGREIHNLTTNHNAWMAENARSLFDEHIHKTSGNPMERHLFMRAMGAGTAERETQDPKRRPAYQNDAVSAHAINNEIRKLKKNKKKANSVEQYLMQNAFNSMNGGGRYRTHRTRNSTRRKKQRKGR